MMVELDNKLFVKFNYMIIIRLIIYEKNSCKLYLERDNCIQHE